VAHLLPDTAEGLLDLMEQMFPEPRPSSTDTHADMLWRAAQRAVVLTMRDQYAAATGKVRTRVQRQNPLR
jgi:hypothetical protein